MKRIGLFSLIALSAVSTPAIAQAFIFQGINQIADSGAGLTSTTDATAVGANPSGLASASKTASYGDMAMTSVSYTYAHTNYDPARISTKAPPVNIGATLKGPAGINFGLLVSPRSAPGQKAMDVENVPTFTGAGYAVYDLKVMQTGILASAGAGFKVPGTQMSLGASLLYGKDGQEITAYANEGDHVTASMDSKYEGASSQGLLGARWDLGGSIIAASYRTAAERHYKGDIASAISDNVYTDFEGVSYQPAMIGAAFETRAGTVGGMIEAKRELWSRGRTVANRGLPYSSGETDFRDSTGVVIGGRYFADASRTYIASCGYYGANTGDGTSTSSAGALAETGVPTSSGMEFGQFESIPRYVVGGGIRQKLATEAAYWMLSGNYQTGTRVIPEGHKGEGWYHLDVYTLAAGINSAF